MENRKKARRAAKGRLRRARAKRNNGKGYIIRRLTAVRRAYKRKIEQRHDEQPGVGCAERVLRKRKNGVYPRTSTEKMLRPWSQQARQLTLRRGTVAHLGNQGCCVHIHTGKFIGSRGKVAHSAC